MDGVQAPCAFAPTGRATGQSSAPSDLGRIEPTPIRPGEQAEDGTCQSAFLRRRCYFAANGLSPDAGCVSRQPREFPCSCSRRLWRACCDPPIAYVATAHS